MAHIIACVFWPRSAELHVASSDYGRVVTKSFSIMPPLLSERSQEAMPELESHPLIKLLSRTYGDDEIDGHVDCLTRRFPKHCSILSSTCTDGSFDSSRDHWLRKSADHDEIDTFWSPSDSDNARDVQTHRRATRLEDLSAGEHQKMMFEGEREAYKANHDLRDVFDIESSFGLYEPVKLDELSTFLASIGSYGAQESKIHDEKFERRRTNGNSWACRREPVGSPNRRSDERQYRGTACRHPPAEGRRTA